MKVPLAGGAPTVLATGADPLGIAVDGVSVYWTDYGTGTVASIPLGGGAPTLLAAGQSGANGICQDATSLYWADSTSETVMKLAK